MYKRPSDGLTSSARESIRLRRRAGREPVGRQSVPNPARCPVLQRPHTIPPRQCQEPKAGYAPNPHPSLAHSDTGQGRRRRPAPSRSYEPPCRRRQRAGAGLRRTSNARLPLQTDRRARAHHLLTVAALHPRPTADSHRRYELFHHAAGSRPEQLQPPCPATRPAAHAPTIAEPSSKSYGSFAPITLTRRHHRLPTSRAATHLLFLARRSRSFPHRRTLTTPSTNRFQASFFGIRE